MPSPRRVLSWESTTDPSEELFRSQNNLEREGKLPEKMRMHFNKCEVAHHEICQQHVHIYICVTDKRHETGRNSRGSGS